eukprot:19161-Rhodomonas_salina.2
MALNATLVTKPLFLLLIVLPILYSHVRVCYVTLFTVPVPRPGTYAAFRVWLRTPSFWDFTLFSLWERDMEQRNMHVEGA